MLILERAGLAVLLAAAVLTPRAVSASPQSRTVSTAATSSWIVFHLPLVFLTADAGLTTTYSAHYARDQVSGEKVRREVGPILIPWEPRKRRPALKR